MPKTSAPELAHEPEPELVPVVNDDARIYRLAYHEPSVERVDLGAQRILRDQRPSAIAILPGLNFVRADLLARAGFNGADYDGRLRVEDPLAVPEYLAKAIAERTAARRSLSTWLAREQRPGVRAAIEARLAKPAPASASVE